MVTDRQTFAIVELLSRMKKIYDPFTEKNIASFGMNEIPSDGAGTGAGAGTGTGAGTVK